jgi:hypothetical protein
VTVACGFRFLPQQEFLCEKACARRVAGHGVGAYLRHEIRLGPKQGPSDEDADVGIGRGATSGLNGAAQRLEPRFRAQGEAQHGEPVAGDEIVDVVSFGVLLHRDVPLRVAHEARNHIDAENMILAAQGAERRALATIARGGFAAPAEDAQHLLQPGDADRHVDEAAAVVLPQCAQMTRRFSHEAEKQGLFRVTARAHPVEELIPRGAVVHDQHSGEFSDVFPREGAFRVPRRKVVMKHLQARDDVFENDRGETLFGRDAGLACEHFRKLLAARVLAQL